MKKMTEQHLINAFGGESQAHMRYLHFANQAEKEKFTNVARLFRAISHAEYVHAGDHYRALKHLNGGFVANSMGAFGPGDTLKNLQLAIDGETFEIEEMYPVYIEVAKFQGEKLAQRSFEWSYATEKLHKQLFEKAFDAVNAGKDVKLGPVQICEVCGYTLEGEAPDRCPVCGAVKEKFTAFE
ncbi:rubrerythrin family protein [Methanosarcina mazei]|jgi:rubrerythrin|uniref:Rubrerythrin family protein n=6 Tax=Methanosarcina mazei TaxID=2209 RepID=A0A0F8RYH3_METMZ|nr:rubrerythrin family protein [Methanosarcina mazei]AGF97562.1 Rubrerythrin [Methanosarcina mazei Tuc01]AKB41443.1 Rubrerythrin [Methanosarcina mazei WWM610]AKB65696.1 Rubrerythrin [Methanosarcina mazei S-6]AKB69161.1 Rubrerythrin [Methanosarcina mazei LYC]AKB71833.1 Rubrerythrin [Methanosarcina mazei C16]